MKEDQTSLAIYFLGACVFLGAAVIGVGLAQTDLDVIIKLNKDQVLVIPEKGD